MVVSTRTRRSVVSMDVKQGNPTDHISRDAKREIRSREPYGFKTREIPRLEPNNSRRPFRDVLRPRVVTVFEINISTRVVVAKVPMRNMTKANP